MRGWRVRARPVLGGLAVVAAVAAAAAGGWLTHRAPTPVDTAQRVVLDRPEGTAVVAQPVRDGNLRVRPLAYACGLPAVFGTHAELEPTGAYCRVAAEVENAGGEAHTFDAREQRVVLPDGRRVAVDASAMAVRRQPLTVDVGGRQRLWLELWFDVPLGAAPTSVALRGDADPPAFLASAPAQRAPDGVRFPLPPSDPRRPA